MAQTSELKLVISAKDEASSVINSTSSALGNIAKAAIVAAAAFAAWKLVEFSKDVVLSASRIQELQLALYAIADANGVAREEVDAAVKSLRENNIAYNEALQITSKFIQSELNVTDAIKLSTAAKDLAVIAGLDSSDATNILTDSIAANEVMLLRQFGIVTTVDQVLEEYGKTIGKTSQEMTQAERKQAFLNLILEEAEKVTGTYDAAMGSASKQLRSMSGRIIPDFIAQIGLTLDTNKTLNDIILTFNNLLSDATTWLVEVADETSETRARFDEWLINLDAETGIVTFFREEWKEIVKLFKNALIPTIIENKDLFIDIAKVIGIIVVAALVLFVEGVKLSIAIVTTLIDLLGKFREKTIEVQDAIKNIRTAIVDTFSGIPDTVNFYIEKAKAFFYDKINSIIAKIFEIKDSFADVLQSISDKIGSFKPNFPSLKIPGFANGVTNFSGGLAVVGEQGPELVNLPRGSNVIPNGSGAIEVNFNNISVRSDNDLDMIARSVKRILNRELMQQQIGG